jgi:hypothetical protein
MQQYVGQAGYVTMELRRRHGQCRATRTAVKNSHYIQICRFENTEDTSRAQETMALFHVLDCARQYGGITETVSDTFILRIRKYKTSAAPDCKQFHSTKHAVTALSMPSWLHVESTQDGLTSR